MDVKLVSKNISFSLSFGNSNQLSVELTTEASNSKLEFNNLTPELLRTAAEMFLVKARELES